MSAIQHLGLARELGLETVGFLMMSHSQPGAVLARQARIMADAGAQCVYVVDSAGALVPPLTAERVAGGRRRTRTTTPRWASTVTRTSPVVWPTRWPPIEAGAVQVDASTRRMGAGAGNTPTEALAAVLEKLRDPHGH